MPDWSSFCLNWAFYSSSFNILRASKAPKGEHYEIWMLEYLETFYLLLHNRSLVRAFLFYSLSVFWTHWQFDEKNCDVGGKFSPSKKLFLGRNRNKSLVWQSGRALCLLFGASKRVNLVTMSLKYYLGFHVMVHFFPSDILNLIFFSSEKLIDKYVCNSM